MQEAVDRCLRWCREPRVPHTVITLNAALLCGIRRDAALRQACHGGDLIVPDGMAVVWTSRLAGVPLPGRVAGIDLMSRLLEAASRERLSVYLLGARKDVVEQLAERCVSGYPGLVIAGAQDGYFDRDQDQAVVNDIRRSSPHMLFVGMPSPFKETWCEKRRAELGVPVIMGVGGSFDVLAGKLRRAPRLVQALGLEWMWRLAMEPRKLWRRYLVTNSEYLLLAAREVIERRTRRGHA